MANVTVLYKFADGDVIQVSVEAESNYPDAIAEAKTQALHAFEGALEVALAEIIRDDSDGDD